MNQVESSFKKFRLVYLFRTRVELKLVTEQDYIFKLDSYAYWASSSLFASYLDAYKYVVLLIIKLSHHVHNFLHKHIIMFELDSFNNQA